MFCPSCQTSNPEDAKFCMNCGTKLAVNCPQCDTELPPAARFCFNCGFQMASVTQSPATSPESHAALPSPPAMSSLGQFIPRDFAAKLEVARNSHAMEGERKIVTILFCDVADSTSMAGQLDPEEWAEIMNRAFEYLITPVYRYEGTVARLLGDAILAFFGAPIAHEDDPQRAVLAGLDIIEGLKPFRAELKRHYGLDFGVRVGINTGLVVVGAVGSDMRMEYTAMGDAINLASRMEQTAATGTVQIAHETYKHVTPLFEFIDIGGIEVKGKAEPVQAFRVLRPKADPGRLRGIEGLDAPLIGRDADMHKLRGAVISLRQGQGQVISVMGEAGLGKSRLIAELRQSPTPVTRATIHLKWIEGRSLSYETTTPYAPFKDIFNDCFGLKPNMQDGDKLVQIKDGMAKYLPDRYKDLVPFIAKVLEIPLTGEDAERIKYLEPPQLRAGIFDAVLTYFEAVAMSEPLVVVFDDIHWIDPTSLDLLTQMLALVDHTMLMVIALFRPRQHEPAWHFHEFAQQEIGHRYTTLTLEPLDDVSSRLLVSSLLHIEGLPEHIRDLILTKAEGNPFFVEEIIRALLDAGVIIREGDHWLATREITDMIIPDTLAAVLTSRLDRLDDESKRVAQAASVIGREFSFDLLSFVYQEASDLENSLAELQRRELIRAIAPQPQQTYMFKHALTQEATYESLLLSKRRQLHHSVAEYLEENNVDAHSEIARHFLEAHQQTSALPHLIEAANRAAHAYATQEAIDYYTNALDILSESEDIVLWRRAYEGLGSALSFANKLPEAMETYQIMLDLGRSNNDVPMQVSALNKMSFLTALRLGDFAEAETYIQESDRLARNNDDKLGLCEMGLIRCMMCTAVADFEGVVHYMDETVSLGRELGVQEQMALGLTHIASSQVFMLQLDKARATIQEALQLSRNIGERLHEAEILTGSAPIYHLLRGEFADAVETAEQGINIATTIGAVQAIDFGYRMLGIVAHQSGDYERAIVQYQNYLEASRRAGIIWTQAEALCLLGSVYLEISPELLPRVIEAHEQALQLMENPGGTLMGASAWVELGQCMLTIGRFGEAGEFFEKGLSIPTVTINLEKPKLLIGAAAVSLARGKIEQAEWRLTEASSLTEQNQLRFYEPMIAGARAQVASNKGETETALKWLDRQEKLALAMGMRPVELQACATQAKVLQDAGRLEDAKKKQQQATSIMSNIADTFTGEGLRSLYCANMEQVLKRIDV